MARYAISQEGAEAMRQLANNIVSSLQEIQQSNKTLQSQVSNVMGDLGVYGTDIWALTLQISGIMEDKQEEIIKLSEVVKSKADVIESLAGLSESSGANGSSQNYSGNADTDGHATTSGMEFAQMKNGMTVVKGDNFDKYFLDYYDSENLYFESMGNTVQIENVSPSQIEGIHLGDSEAQDMGGFWSMHASSKDFFMETASHIPDVQAALANGTSLDILKDDPVLGKCASIYFDPQNVPRVEKWDGFYTFDGDGRHRILAARELGYDIPVRVMGCRRRR